MDVKHQFQRFRSRVQREGLLKAILIGFIIGFSLNLVFATVSWMFFPSLFWLGFVILAVATAVSATILYLVKFKPSDDDIARRIDREFNLQERVITMRQFKDDQSYIMQKQREDAEEQLEKNSANKIKFVIGTAVIVVASVVTFLSLSVTSLPVLATLNVIPQGMQVIEDIEKESKWFEVSYEIRAGEGELLGELTQRVRAGESTSGVLAVPNVDWIFTYWEDGLKDPYRVDESVKGNATHYAIFTETRLPDGLPDEPREADDDPDKPPTNPGDGDGNGSGGMAQYEYVARNQVYDGETDYSGKVYDMAYEEAMEWIAGNPDISEAERDLIIGYFKTIEK